VYRVLEATVAYRYATLICTFYYYYYYYYYQSSSFQKSFPVVGHPLIPKPIALHAAITELASFLTLVRVHWNRTVKLNYEVREEVKSQKPSSMSFEKRLRSRPTGVMSKKAIGERMILRNTRSWSLVEALNVTYTTTHPRRHHLPSLLLHLDLLRSREVSHTPGNPWNLLENCRTFWKFP